jgi:hypothetical protein
MTHLAKRIQWTVFLVLIAGSCGLGSCGGPKKEARVANFIQTLMANTIEAFATKQEGSSDVTFFCGDRSGEEGSFTFTVPAGLSDPLTLIQYIATNGNVANLDVTFTNCVIKACDETITLNGGTAKLGMNISTLLAGAVGSGEIPAAFTLQVQNQESEGALSETLSYSYIIEAVYTRQSIGSITIKEADPANPLVVNDTTYEAAKLSELADGC